MKEDPIQRVEREQAAKKATSGKAKIVAIVLAVVLAIVVVQDVTLCMQLNQDKIDLTERITALQQEYNNLSSDYEAINIQLDSSRQEVAGLIERIRQTEATNRAKMRQYEKELGSLRTIMRGYITQIDSLNNQNKRLAAELSERNTELAESTRQNKDLSAKVNNLSKKIEVGSVLKARALTVEAYNASAKVTDRSSRVKNVYVSMTLVENTLAPRGPVKVYVRLKDPEGTLLADGTNASFKFGGETLAASASREVEYNGAEVDLGIYVNNVTGYVKGVYTVEVFTSQAKLGSAELMLR